MHLGVKVSNQVRVILGEGGDSGRMELTHPSQWSSIAFMTALTLITIVNIAPWYCIRTSTRHCRINHMDQLIVNKCYMCTQWTRGLYSVVITRTSNPPISQFKSV